MTIAVFPTQRINISVGGFEGDDVTPSCCPFEFIDSDDNPGVAEQSYDASRDFGVLMGPPAAPYWDDGKGFWTPTPLYHPDPAWPQSSTPNMNTIAFDHITFEDGYWWHNLFAREGYEREGNHDNCLEDMPPDASWKSAGSCFSIRYRILDVSPPVFTVQPDSLINGQRVVNTVGENDWLTGRCITNGSANTPQCDSKSIGITVVAQDPWASTGLPGALPMSSGREFVLQTNFSPVGLDDQNDGIAAGDVLNGDGVDEILVADRGNIRIYDQHGTVLGGFSTEQPLGRRSATGDVDGDGLDEIVILDSAFVKIFHADGQLIRAFAVSNLSNDPTLAVGNLNADINGDEIVIGDGGVLRVFDQYGSEITQIRLAGVSQGDLVAIGNVSRAGLDEIIVSSRTSRSISIFDNAGVKVASNALNSLNCSTCSPYRGLAVGRIDLPGCLRSACMVNDLDEFAVADESTVNIWNYVNENFDFQTIASLGIPFGFPQAGTLALGANKIIIGSQQDYRGNNIHILVPSSLSDSGLGGLEEVLGFSVQGFEPGDALIVGNTSQNSISPEIVVVDGEHVKTFDLGQDYYGMTTAVISSSFLLDSPMNRSFAVGDVIPNNGLDEIVVADKNLGRLGLYRVYDGMGDLLKSFIVKGDFAEGFVTVGDVDGQQPDEILLVQDHGIWAFDASGSQVKLVSIPSLTLNDGFIAGAGDLDGQGADQFVIANPLSSPGPGGLFRASITVYNRDGEVVSSFDSNLADLVVGNLEGGGPDRIVVQDYDPTVLDKTGQFLSEYCFCTSGANGSGSRVVLGDVNGGGVNEIIVGSLPTTHYGQPVPPDIAIFDRRVDGVTIDSNLVDYHFLDVSSTPNLGGQLDCSSSDLILCNYFFDSNRVGWVVEISDCGLHRFNFKATNVYVQSELTLDVKVDICDPTVKATVTSGTPGSNGWYVSPVDILLQGNDTGSGIDRFEYSLDYSSVKALNPPSFARVCMELKTQATVRVCFGGIVGRELWDCLGISGSTDCLFELGLKITDQALLQSSTCVDLTTHRGFPCTLTSLEEILPCFRPLSCKVEPVYELPIVQVHGEGIHNLSFFAVDKAGRKSANQSIVISIDTVNPDTIAHISRPADHNGWYNHPVTISWTGSDVTSGIGACDPDRTYSGPDASAVVTNGECADNAGNTSSSSVTINYDATPPETRIASAKDGRGYGLTDGGSTLFGPGNFTFEGSDSLSGAAGFECSLDSFAFSSCTSPFVGGSTSGPHTLKVRALDKAGNRDPTPATFSWTIVTSAQASQNLIDVVKGMHLSSSTETSLLGPLNNIVKILSDRDPTNDKDACDKLGSFINIVNTKLSQGKLTNAQAVQLRQLATDIMTKIGC